ncbi:MAG: LysE family translocator [Pseudomonadales bacterium]|nr:LysE family translocator [Pseudomonadales bacterium]
MELNNIIIFIAVATLLVISPGPNGLLIARTVPLFGHKAGLGNVIGFVLAFYLHGTLSICGISILLVQSSNAFFIFKMLGSIYLIWLGVKAIKSALRPKQSLSTATERQTNRQHTNLLRSAIGEGFKTNALNPKVSMFYLAAFPQFISFDSHALSAYVLVTVHALVNALWSLSMVYALLKIKRITNNVRFRAWLNSITGIVFIGFGVKLALTRN